MTRNGTPTVMKTTNFHKVRKETKPVWKTLREYEATKVASITRRTVRFLLLSVFYDPSPVPYEADSPGIGEGIVLVNSDWQGSESAGLHHRHSVDRSIGTE